MRLSILAAALLVAGAVRAQAPPDPDKPRPAAAALAAAGITPDYADGAAAPSPATDGATGSPAPVAPAPAVDRLADAPTFWVTERVLPLRSSPSLAAPIVEPLRIRDAVREVPSPTGVAVPGWRYVDHGGARGFVPEDALSDLWIRIDKSERTLYLYRGPTLVRTYPTDVSISAEDKVRRSGIGEGDHYRMPEGTFFVTRLNANSEYYRAFVVSYPGPVHAERGLREGLITPVQYDAIVRADREGREPPMGTRLGGMIEIHGSGSGRRRAWTRGCAALRDVHMDELWGIVRVGTPVVIQP